MRTLVESLGGKRIEAKKGQQQIIPETVLDLDINLLIRCRPLVSRSDFTLCGDCCAPLHEDLLPSTRFQEALLGKPWRCQSCHA